MTFAFKIMKGFFLKPCVEFARQQLDPHFDVDEDVLRYPSMDLLLRVPGKSPILDGMFEQILEKAGLQKIIGPDIKIRDMNARRMNGKFDNGLQWHTDGWFEHGVAIPLTDIPLGGPATGFKRNGRTYPAYCEAGDVYVFHNQIPHCRMRNWRRVKATVVLAGLFPTVESFTPGAIPWVPNLVSPHLRLLTNALRFEDEAYDWGESA